MMGSMMGLHPSLRRWARPGGGRPGPAAARRRLCWRGHAPLAAGAAPSLGSVATLAALGLDFGAARLWRVTTSDGAVVRICRRRLSASARAPCVDSVRRPCFLARCRRPASPRACARSLRVGDGWLHHAADDDAAPSGLEPLPLPVPPSSACRRRRGGHAGVPQFTPPAPVPPPPGGSSRTSTLADQIRVLQAELEEAQATAARAPAAAVAGAPARRRVNAVDEAT